jgi:hypothetical protein
VIAKIGFGNRVSKIRPDTVKVESTIIACRPSTWIHFFRQLVGPVFLVLSLHHLFGRGFIGEAVSFAFSQNNPPRLCFNPLRRY